MGDDIQGEVTQLLNKFKKGEEKALEQLVRMVYSELKKIAGSMLSSERRDHTLQATELVNEAYLRLFDATRLNWQDRFHFIGSAALAMRRILIDHARKKHASKRISKDDLVPLELSGEPFSLPEQNILALDDALKRLAQLDPRQAKIVELRFFGGLSEQEVAALLELSRMTISREWKMAKLWLHREISK